MSPWRVQPSANYNGQEDFERFALQVYKNAGMKSINKIDRTPLYSIKVSDISDHDLSIIVEKELEDAEIEKNGLAMVGPFSGGIVFLCENGDKIYHHSGYISDYKDWLRLLNNKSKKWEEIWVGYPAFYARIQKNEVQISEVIPNAIPKDEDIIAEYNLLEFKTKLDKVVEELREFKERIRAILLQSDHKYSNEIPELLIELNYNEPENYYH